MNDAAYYDREQLWGQAPEPYQVQVRADVLDLLPDGAKSVLDVGCGDGYVTNAVPAGRRVVGVDLAPSALRHLKAGRVAGSIEALPFPDASFDLVMANDVLEHLGDAALGRAAAELARVARRWLLLTVPALEQREASFTRCRDCGEVFHVNHHQRTFSEKSLLAVAPPPFRPREVRYSGGFLPPPDPVVPLRHGLGRYRQWEGSVCPACGWQGRAEERDRGADSLDRLLDGLCADLWWGGEGRQGVRVDRSELVALFERGGRRVRRGTPQHPALAGDLLEADLANPLQEVRDWTIGPGWARYRLHGLERRKDGVTGVSGGAAPWIEIRLPAQGRIGDEVEIEASGLGPGGALGLVAWDASRAHPHLLAELPLEASRRVLKAKVDATFGADPFGLQIHVLLRSSAVVHRVRYRPVADGRPAKMVRLRKGHNVLAVDAGPYPRSWGLLVEEAGAWARPEWLADALDATAAPDAPARWEQLAAWAAAVSERWADTTRQLRAQLEAKERDRAAAEVAYGGAQRGLAEAGERERILLGQLEEKERERGRAEAAYAEAQRALAETGERARGLLEQLEGKERERVKAEEAYSGALRELSAAGERERGLLGQLEEKERKRAKAEAAYAEAQRGLSEAGERERGLLGQLEEKERERAKAEEAYSGALREFSAASEEERRLLGQVEEKERERAKAEAAYAKAQRGLAEAGERERGLLGQLEEKERERVKAETARAEAQRGLAESGERQRSLLGQLEEKERERAKAGAAYAEAQRGLAGAGEREQSLLGQLEEKEQERVKAEAAYSGALRELSAAGEREHSLLGQLEEQERKRARAEAARAEAQRGLSEAGERERSLLGQLEKTERERINAEEARSGALRDLSESGRRERRLQEEAGALRSRADAVKQELRVERDRRARIGRRRVQRVLILSHMFPHPDQPGSGPFVLEQVAALRRHEDVDARVISCRPFWMNTLDPRRLWRAARAQRDHLRNLHWTQREGVPVIYPPYLVGGMFRFVVHAITYRAAVTFIAERIWSEFRFDLVHAHTGYLDGVAATALARRFNVPLVITEHTGPLSYLTGRFGVRQQTLRSYAAADRILCVSESLTREVQGLLPKAARERVSTHHNGVDLSRFMPPESWRPDPRAPRLLAIGSLDENKNPLLLLDAFVQVRAAVPGATLDIVGQGELQDVVERRVKDLGLGDSVRLRGQVGRDEVAYLLREQCDMLVVSSMVETFGVVVIEALASGKPVVSTRCGGPEDILGDPALGNLCTRGDARALAQAICEVANRLRTFDLARIREDVLRRFDLRVIARGLDQTYHEAAEARTRPFLPV